LGELQDLSKNKLYKAVNVFPVRLPKDVWDRSTLTQKRRGFTDAAWRSKAIQNIKLVNAT